MENENRVDPDRVTSVAEAVGKARALLGYSIDGAADRLGISPSILRDAEDGAFEINDQLLALIESGYGIELETLMRPKTEYAPRTPLAYDAENGVLRVGTLGVRFRVGEDDNNLLLRGFSSAVRRQRHTPLSEPLQLRKADIVVLGELLDIDDPELDERAQFWFGQTEQTAQGFRRMLLLASLREAPEGNPDTQAA